MIKSVIVDRQKVKEIIDKAFKETEMKEHKYMVALIEIAELLGIRLGN